MEKCKLFTKQISYLCQTNSMGPPTFGKNYTEEGKRRKVNKEGSTVGTKNYVPKA